MLKQLRQKRVMKKILWALALLIIPAFALWGTEGLRESRNYAGLLFGKRISLDEYRASLNAVRNRALLTYGSKFYEVQDKLNLEEAAWEHLIMLKEAKQNRIKVSDEEVVARIASFGFFQNRDGSFNQQAYKTILNSTFKAGPRNFEEEIRQSLMIEKLIQGIIKAQVTPSESEKEEAMAKRIEAYKDWRQKLYKRANLVSYIKTEEENPDE